MTLKQLEYWNVETAKKLKQFGISKLRLTCYGNSIASGYSEIYPTIPLLFRNTTLQRDMKYCEITLESFHFARARSNNEDHTFTWLLNNITQSEIYRMNRQDYENNTMKNIPFTEEQLDQYFPLFPKHNRGLQDIIKESNETLANIVIYHGATGSVIDNFTRKGRHKNLFPAQKDIQGLDAILRTIQNFNRQGSETQVYLCGIPNPMGSNVFGLVNHQLGNLAKKYANVVYIPPLLEQFVHLKNGMIQMDIHYSDIEYQKLNLKLMKSLCEHYLACKKKIMIDRWLYQVSSQIELGQDTLPSLKDYFEQCYHSFSQSGEDLKKFQKQLLKYVLERHPHDYFCIPKKQLIKTIKRGGL